MDGFALPRRFICDLSKGFPLASLKRFYLYDFVVTDWLANIIEPPVTETSSSSSVELTTPSVTDETSPSQVPGGATTTRFYFAPALMVILFGHWALH